MVTFKLIPLSFLFFFLLLNISLCSAKLPPTIFLPVTKDSSTLQYTTVIGQRTPLVPVKFVVHLAGRSLWVDCERGYSSSTYEPARCKSRECSFSKSHACGDCIFKPQIEPGCNNNTCYIWGENPLIDSYMDRAEIAEDVLAVGSTPGVIVTTPKFIFTCVQSYLSGGLAKGVTGIAGFGHDSPVSIPNQLASFDSRFSRKFGICFSSSTKSRGVIFIGASPYYVYNPKIDISKDLVYTPLLQSQAFLQTPEYYVKVSSIRIAGKDVPLNRTLLSIKKSGAGGARISTATPFTVLDNSIYNAVKIAFINALPKNVTIVEPPTKQFETCFSSKNIRSTNVGPDVPAIDFVFHKRKAFWRIYGANSMVQVTKDVICLGFVAKDQTWRPSIDIGGHQMEENLLEFDLPGKRIGFSSSLKLQQTSCSKYDYTSKSTNQ